jgi:hypothetical protein
MTSALTTAMLAGVDRLSPTAVVCAGFAGLAVFLTLRHPAGELRRMRLGGSRLAVVTAPCWRLLKGRADAPPLGWFEPRSARRRRERLIMEAPQALELMAACLGAGLPARAACAQR